MNGFGIDKMLKQKDMEFDYRQMPTAQSAQQCLNLAGDNFSFLFFRV